MGFKSVAPTVETAAPPDIHTEGRTFRCILRAMSRPGSITAVCGAASERTPLPPAIASVALCLFDAETPVWLDATFNTEPVRRYFGLHTGVPIVNGAERASFALIGAPTIMPSLEAFRHGEQDYPDRSTTLLVQVASLTSGPSICVAGPGIESRTTLNPDGLPSWFWSSWDANVDRFPLGIDIVFTDGHNLVGLPRTTKRV
ncbi:phosphonate C-P lyase system protein PhnH [Bradyrhizobium sp. SSUT77]|uniref:phosphonate C-P lyase system protein PhnH n=1 Tax=Bradyrhizobium sp. SSUT77 TaxID=3040603 RepID=UPI002446E84E|nr:phosphonate C-P lyase system protein PhnH [Bradyrhizobium sp. SSUT77]MDH2347769.1 phosphonate C-P lyase system protein PhnH [Bradyrhizobium sp. SSUT77]